MISMWITIGLILSAVSVSSLGAYFSIVGLGALFSGAMVAVWIMAGALEFSKFVLAAYLHQAWQNLNKIYKSYLVFAVITLSVITSVGIFGFLSDAYQSASMVLESQTTKIQNIENQQKLYKEEVARLTRSVEEIPANRVTRRMKLRAEIEPRVAELTSKQQTLEAELSEAKLAVIDVKKRVGPLIFIAKSFNMDIDLVVRYLIMIFVSVFDPLAICLVIATTHALESRRNPVQNNIEKENPKKEEKSELKVVETNNKPPISETEDQDIIVQMNFKDENTDSKTEETTPDTENKKAV